MREQAREAMQFDAVVVGGRPGLAAAIRLKQRAPEATVCLDEKGSEIGARILSGAVIKPRALDELVPDWTDRGAPLDTSAAEDRLLYLTAKRSARPPTPPQGPGCRRLARCSGRRRIRRCGRISSAAKRLRYGVRALSEGGLQSIPRLTSRAQRCSATPPASSTGRRSRARTRP